MYDIISQIIDHVWTQGDNAQSTILYICASLILMLTSVFIDLMYRIFRNIWHR